MKPQSEIRETVADKFKAFRKAKHWSLGQMAQKLDVPRKTYINYDTGRNRPPLKVVKAFASLAGVHYLDLIKLME